MSEIHSETIESMIIGILFIIFVLTSSSPNMAYGLMLVLILFAALVIYSLFIKGEVEGALFRLLLLSLLAHRIYIAMLGFTDAYYVVLFVPVMAAAGLCVLYGKDDSVRLMSSTILMLTTVSMVLLDSPEYLG
jgi:hypothetical protein